MTYAEKDWELAKVFIAKHQYLDDPTAPLAHYFATVRREALEEAAVVAETFDDWATNEHFLQSRKHIARRIRALKDGAK